MSTAMDIFDMNIPVIVVRDCVATLHGDAIHHAALKSLGFAIGDKYVMDAEQALQKQ
jgi:isochorismate hydrolase